MDTGGIAWMLASAALVLLMTPGLAFFYGGLVKAQSVVSMMMMSFGALGLVAVLWILYGAAMSSVDSVWAFAGNPFAGFAQTGMAGEDLVGIAFGATFAILTTALISGAIADRARFGAWLVFAGLWSTLVYFPVAAWVWGGGWLQNLGDSLGGLPAVIDYAGGTAVHINAGAAALALALVLGPRRGFAKGSHRPHNVPLVLLGAGLLWFGWFGFNAGAAVGDGSVDAASAGLIFLNTIGAPAAGILGWLIVERARSGKPTSIGAASGAVAGLVAITPACADLTPGLAILLGLLSGAACAFAIDLKYRLGYDDSLDVVGLHLVAGVIGTLYLGLFANGTGLFTGGDTGQLIVQGISVLAVTAYSFVMALVIAFAIEKSLGFRVRHSEEIAGIDLAIHGESGYVLETR
ncbi:ammonium transporter [Ruicaihuangia caeni]|uniref:ammonium transporter n=1 Tax=Ruicaihuangia caeni TaxID=3042517 RepID=UPI003390004E